MVIIFDLWNPRSSAESWSSPTMAALSGMGWIGSQPTSFQCFYFLGFRFECWLLTSVIVSFQEFKFILEFFSSLALWNLPGYNHSEPNSIQKWARMRGKREAQMYSPICQIYFWTSGWWRKSDRLLLFVLWESSDKLREKEENKYLSLHSRFGVQFSTFKYRLY